mgnify:FL=1
MRIGLQEIDTKTEPMTFERETRSATVLQSTGNLFADLGAPEGGEKFLPLLQTDTTCVERIASHGSASPPGFWYDQPDDEWVMIVTGSAELAFDDDSRMSMRPGDWVTIPAHCRHRVESTAPDTVWLAVHVRHLPATVSCA